MEPIEIIVISAIVLFLGLNVFLYIRKKRKGLIGCSSDCGCQAVNDMKRAFREAKKEIDKTK